MSTKNRRLASQMMNPMEISLADEVRKTLQAECYGANSAKVAAANGISNPNQVRAGTRIYY